MKKLTGTFLAVLIGVTMVWLWPQPQKEEPKAYAQTLPIITYHAIRTDNEPLGMTMIDYDRFAEEMRYLHEQGYMTLSMDETVQFLKGKKFPPKIVAINFDDGLSSSLRAVPLLVKYGLKATFWIITDMAAPDPKRPGADSLYMKWITLELLNTLPNIGIYSHTMTHPWQKGNTLVDWVEGRTPGKTKKDALYELTESKKLLAQHFGHRIPYIAWPDGAYDETLTNMARQVGYKAAVTTDDGLNLPDNHLFHIHRTMINGGCDEKIFAQILTDGKYRSCGAN